MSDQESGIIFISVRDAAKMLLRESSLITSSFFCGCVTMERFVPTGACENFLWRCCFELLALPANCVLIRDV